MSGNLNGYSLAYDALYRPVTLTDARNNPTTWLYDPSGALDKMTYPSGDFVEALTWDHDDQPLTAQNGRGQTFSYAYGDNESRLTQVLSADVDDAYTYDAYGRLHSVSDAPGVRSFSYDDDDLPLSQALTYTALPANSTFNQGYGYNDDGSRSSLTLSNQAGTYNGSFSYTYDGRGELTGLVNPSGETYGWSYYANGWLNTQQVGNAATTTYSYNAVGELTTLATMHGSTALSSFTMASAGHYDGAGNLLGLTATLPASPANYSGNTVYQYDSHDQLNNEQSSRFIPYTNVFAYDGAGNPTTYKGTTQTFSADNQNTAIGYDLDGNPQSWGTYALSFDTASHLTSVGTELTAGYSAEGLRAWKQSSAGTTYFVYDGLTPIAEANSSGTVTAVNTWGANGLASRRSIASSSSTFYTFDVQGSTAQRLDLNGNVLGSYGFDAYGTRYSTDNSSDPYTGFGAQSGYYRDAETGLSLLGHRYYDPGQGRFLNRDPAGYGGGLNLYGYAANNPMAFIDPTGNSIAGIVGGVVGGVLGGVVGSALGPAGAAWGILGGAALGAAVGDGLAGTPQDIIPDTLLGYEACSLAWEAVGPTAALAYGPRMMAGGGGGGSIGSGGPRQLQPGDDLGPIMQGSPYTPTQSDLYASKANTFADEMRNGTWDWSYKDPQNPLMIDPNGAVMSGHHRVAAAQMAGVPIPESAITRYGKPTTHLTRPWGSMTVLP